MADPARLGPVEVLERFANGASLVRIAEGRRRGELCLVADAVALEVVDLGTPRRTPDRAAHERARSLLRSQLTARQRDRYDRTGSFWVLTPAAWVRLGGLYDLRVRSRRAPWVERSTCVVTEGFAERPLDDLWSELVGWLAVDPAGFLRIGNPQPVRPPLRPPGRRGELEVWLATLREEWRGLRAGGLELEAAHLAYEAAVALDRAGRSRWAAPYAERAWRQVVDEAERFPDDAEHLRRAHEPLAALASSLVVR